MRENARTGDSVAEPCETAFEISKREYLKSGLWIDERQWALLSLVCGKIEHPLKRESTLPHRFLPESACSATRGVWALAHTVPCTCLALLFRQEAVVDRRSKSRSPQYEVGAKEGTALPMRQIGQEYSHIQDSSCRQAVVEALGR